MDPWNFKSDSVGQALGVSAPNIFEDNFVDVMHIKRTAVAEPAKRLPDTDKYLDKLYVRLSRLQQTPSSKQLLSSLQSGRADHLERLLNSPGGPVSDTESLSTDEPLTTSYLQRRLLPHTVPLSSDELLHLLRADQLQHQTDQLTDQQEHQTGQLQHQTDQQERDQSAS